MIFIIYPCGRIPPPRALNSNAYPTTVQAFGVGVAWIFLISLAYKDDGYTTIFVHIFKIWSKIS